MRSSFLEDHPLVCACPEPPRLVDNQTRAFSLIPTPTLTTVFFARCQETPDNELGGVWALFHDKGWVRRAFDSGVDWIEVRRIHVPGDAKI